MIKLKKTLFIVFIIILTIMITKLIWNNKTDFDPEEFNNEDETTEIFYKGWKTFTDAEGGYNLKYPPGWMLEEGAGNDMIRADINKNTYVGLQIRMLENSYLDFEEFCEPYLVKFKNDMITHRNGSMKQVAFNSSFSSEVSYSRTAFEFSRANGERWYLIEYLWQKDDKIICFECGIMYDKQVEFEPILDSIADSFEFIEEK